MSRVFGEKVFCRCVVQTTTRTPLMDKNFLNKYLVLCNANSLTGQRLTISEWRTTVSPSGS